MDEGLLGYYEKELAYLRRAAGAFAEANPKVAGRLRLSADQVQDPMVACFDVRDFEDSLKNEVRAVILEWVNQQTDRLNVKSCLIEFFPIAT